MVREFSPFLRYHRFCYNQHWRIRSRMDCSVSCKSQAGNLAASFVTSWDFSSTLNFDTDEAQNSLTGTDSMCCKNVFWKHSFYSVSYNLIVWTGHFLFFCDFHYFSRPFYLDKVFIWETSGLPGCNPYHFTTGILQVAECATGWAEMSVRWMEVGLTGDTSKRLPGLVVISPEHHFVRMVRKELLDDDWWA